MGNLDLKFYWAVFLRRLPYFLVIVAFLTAGRGDGGDDPAAGLHQLGQHAGRAAADPGRARPDHGAGQSLRAGADHRAAADDPGQPAGARQAHRALRRHRPADVGQRHGQRHQPAYRRSSASSPTPPARPTPPAPPSSASPSTRRPASSPTRAPTSWSTSCSRRTSSSAPAAPTTRWSSSSPRSTGSRASSSGRARRSPSSRPRTSSRCPTAWPSGATARSSSRSG